MERSIKELSKYRFNCSLEALEDATAQIKRAEEFTAWVEDYLREQQVL